MKNIIDYCEQKQLPLAFISLDQEKAFDRIDYDFLFKTFSAFNFRNDQQISGVKFPGTSTLFKLSLYADDSLAVCTCDASIERVLHWCSLYGGASGAKLNIQKAFG